MINCIENIRIWHIINKINKIKKQNLILTSEQRNTLCNYVNKKPFDKKILNSIFN